MPSENNDNYSITPIFPICFVCLNDENAIPYSLNFELYSLIFSKIKLFISTQSTKRYIYFFPAKADFCAPVLTAKFFL